MTKLQAMGGLAFLDRTVGGIPPERAWQMLELSDAQLLARLEGSWPKSQ